MLSEITFFILAGIAIVSAVLMISRTKALQSAIYFCVTLLAVAGIFLQLRAPLLFGDEIILVVCVATMLAFFAVEVAKFDVAIVAEYRGRFKIAAICAIGGVALAAVALLAQRRWFAGQSVTTLLPNGPLGPAPTASAVVKFFFGLDILPVALSLAILLIAAVGFGALFQRKAGA